MGLARGGAMAPVLLLLVFILVLRAESVISPTFLQLEQGDGYFTMSNGYLFLRFNLTHPHISHLQGRFSGKGVYGQNTLTEKNGVGICLEAGKGGYLTNHARSSDRNIPAKLSVDLESKSMLSVRVSGVVAGNVESTWTLSLQSHQRFVDLKVKASSPQTKTSSSEAYYGVGAYFHPPSGTAVFADQGVLQQMNAVNPMFVAPPGRPVDRFYAMGSGSSATVFFQSVGKHSHTKKKTERSVEWDEDAQFVMMSAPARNIPSANLYAQGTGWWNQRKTPVNSKEQFFNSGFLLLMCGAVEAVYPEVSAKVLAPRGSRGNGGSNKNKHANLSQFTDTVAATVGTAEAGFHYAHLRLSPNDFDFPLSEPYLHSMERKRLGVLHKFTDSKDFSRAVDSILPRTQENDEIYLKEIHALHNAIYGSSVGSLKSFVYPGALTPTISFNQMIDGWEWGYYPNSNFFDPDAFVSAASMILSGEPRLQEEARDVFMYSLRAMKDNLVPHHFATESKARNMIRRPAFNALSGARQPGPNFFTVLTAIYYVKYSGDYDWLCENYYLVHDATKYVFEMIDKKVGLVRADGPLMIDTLRREGYTGDTNAFMIGYFHILADVYADYIKLVERGDNLGQCSQREGKLQGMVAWVTQLRETATTANNTMNEMLWKTDHYVSMRTRREVQDMGDHDTNFLAIAFGISNPARSEKIVEFMSKSKCPHCPSQKYYASNDCYGGNTGDSDVRLARIALADAWARHRMRDEKGLNQLLDGIDEELKASVWMYERYKCPGSNYANIGEHSPYFFEWPSVYTIGTVTLRYGINLGLATWEVYPLGRSSYLYLTPTILVAYDAEKGVALCAPGPVIKRKVILKGLAKQTEYILHTHDQSGGLSLVSSADGTLSFEATTGKGTCVSAVRASDLIAA